MSEFHRVLKKGGKLVLIDIDYPADRNWLGMRMTRLWAALGDILRDMGAMFREFNFEYTDREIGGFGSVHLAFRPDLLGSCCCIPMALLVGKNSSSSNANLL